MLDAYSQSTASGKADQVYYRSDKVFVAHWPDLSAFSMEEFT